MEFEATWEERDKWLEPVIDICVRDKDVKIFWANA